MENLAIQYSHAACGEIDEYCFRHILSFVYDRKTVYNCLLVSKKVSVLAKEQIEKCQGLYRKLIPILPKSRAEYLHKKIQIMTDDSQIYQFMAQWGPTIIPSFVRQNYEFQKCVRSYHNTSFVYTGTCERDLSDSLNETPAQIHAYNDYVYEFEQQLPKTGYVGIIKNMIFWIERFNCYTKDKYYTSIVYLVTPIGCASFPKIDIISPTSTFTIRPTIC